MINIAICDDNEIFLQELAKSIERALEGGKVIYTITKFTSGICLLNAAFYDIVFLDIEMDGLNGIETAIRLRERGDQCKLIFLTAHKKYVFSAFDVDAAHYLVKPIQEEKLKAVLFKCINNMGSDVQDFISVRKGTSLSRVLLKDILYIEVLDRKLFVHSSFETYDFYDKLHRLEDNLPPDFFRCHRSYMVNLSFVIRYNKVAITLKNGEIIPISKRKYSEFCKSFLYFLKNKGDII